MTMSHASPAAGRHRGGGSSRALPLLSALLSALLLAAWAPPAQAQAQWMWRDKDGQVNASDRPPPRDIPEKDIIARPTPEVRRTTAPRAADGAASGAASAAAATPLDRELQARKRTAEQEQTAKTRAEEERAAAQRAENCRSARGHVAALETGQRIVRVNAQGEQEILDDRGRAEDLRRAREVIASECR